MKVTAAQNLGTCPPNSPTLEGTRSNFPQIWGSRGAIFSIVRKFCAAKAHNQVKSIVGISFLMFFLGGCVTPVSQGGQSVKCRQAEEAVNSAQKQFDDVIWDLAKTPQGESTKNSVPAKVQSLQEAEEKAYEVCNRVY